MNRRQIALTLTVCSSLTIVCGCAVVLVGAGAGTVAYLKGSLNIVLDKDIDRVYAATLKALDQLEISATRKEKDALSAVVAGRTSDDKKVTVRIKAAENNLTKLSIKIGTFGNQTQSQLIYDEIKKHL